MICPSCRKDIDESLFRPPLHYCPHCGQTLKAGIGEQATEDILFCPYCGKELSSKANFCTHCGEELARRITPSYYIHEERELTEERPKPIIDTSGKKGKQDKLYKQWMTYANLPTEATPTTESPRDMPARRVRKESRLPILYALLAVLIIIIAVCVVFLILQPG